MKNIHHWPLEHWHIEVSSKCSLRCPRCTRQEVPQDLINTELSLDWFKQNFNNDILQCVKKITFCGDDGDPIYAKQFTQILNWLRMQNKSIQFVIITNGSYKTTQWWKTIGEILNENDNLHFSIDGWDQESNNKYRVNCNWQSIIAGINAIKSSKVFKTWAAIAFKFNENKLGDMQKMAKQLGFDCFQLTLSTKFGSNYNAYDKNDYLEPSKKFVAKGRFTRSTTNLSGRKWIDKTVDTFLRRFKKTDTSQQSIIPLCMIGNKGLYINAEGKFYPCCWTGLRYQHNKNIFSYINGDNKTLEDILDDPMWGKLFLDMKMGSAPYECHEKCSAKKWNEEHATSW